MFINRGNHEAKEMNRQYGFEGEVKHKHGEQTYKVCPYYVVQLEHPSHPIDRILSAAIYLCVYN